MVVGRVGGNGNPRQKRKTVGGGAGYLRVLPLFPYLALGLSRFRITLMAMPLSLRKAGR